MKADAIKKIALSSFLAAGLVACAGNDTKEMSSAEKPAATAAAVEQATLNSLYEVHDHGRIYVFYDKSLYQSFLKTGHTAYMYSQIGAGPKGETMVYALTGKDKKKREGIPSVDLLAGKIDAAEDFYAEMRAEGRIYVFDNPKDMEAVRQVGEAAYRFTDIGAGPKGETVVYVLNKGNKKKKPVALMEAFKKNNMM